MNTLSRILAAEFTPKMKLPPLKGSRWIVKKKLVVQLYAGGYVTLNVGDEVIIDGITSNTNIEDRVHFSGGKSMSLRLSQFYAFFEKKGV